MLYMKANRLLVDYMSVDFVFVDYVTHEGEQIVSRLCVRLGGRTHEGVSLHTFTRKGEHIVY